MNWLEYVLTGWLHPLGHTAPWWILALAALLSLPGRLGRVLAHALLGFALGGVLASLALEVRWWLAACACGALGGVLLPRTLATAGWITFAFTAVDLLGAHDIDLVAFWGLVTTAGLLAARFHGPALQGLRALLAAALVTAALGNLIRSSDGRFAWPGGSSAGDASAFSTATVWAFTAGCAATLSWFWRRWENDGAARAEDPKG